jgi:hypothetical protein
MKILNPAEELKKWAEQMPVIPTDDATIIYENNYYDGPLNGVLLWNKKKYYFCDYNIPEEIKNHTKRMFVIIELAKEQEGKDEYWQDILKDKSKEYVFTQDQIKARWSDVP